MIKDKIFYNEASSLKLGWKPDWLGCESIDEKLIEKIEEFQKENDLGVDGLLGPLTFKRLYTEYEAKKELIKHQLMGKFSNNKIKKFIEVGWNHKQIEIEWDKFVGLKDSNCLELPSNTYRKVNSERNPQMIVVHYDACLSSKSCYEVLKKRGLSAHFLIDNDGTIYQSVLLNNSAYHAGHVNMDSIGIEISNAVYSKYNGHYKIKGFGERELRKGLKCHGKKYDLLDFYPIQVEALKVLVHSLSEYYNIPLVYPKDNNEKMLTTISKDVQEKKFSGIVGHFHIDKCKMDPIQLNFDDIV